MTTPLMPMDKAAMLALFKRSNEKYRREAVKRIINNVYEEVIDSASKKGGTVAEVIPKTYGVEGYHFDIVASIPDIIAGLEPLFPGSKITYSATASDNRFGGTEDITMLDSKTRSAVFVGCSIVNLITVDWS